jgi:hypothetical protein
MDDIKKSNMDESDVKAFAVTAEVPTQQALTDIETTAVGVITAFDSETNDKVPSGPESRKEEMACKTFDAPDKQAVEVLPAADNVMEGTGGAGEYVLAAGKLKPEFPSDSVKREFYRVVVPPPETTPTDAYFYSVLSNASNFYLAKSLCWIFEIGGIESYVVIPANSNQLKAFITVLNQQDKTDPMFDTVVGRLGPMAPPEMCNGRTLPLLMLCRLENQTVTSFVASINKETALDTTVAENLFNNLIKLTDNNGSSDEHRAVNYLVLTCIDLYRFLGDSLSESVNDTQIFPFNGVTAKPIDGNGGRKKIQIVFQYENPKTTAQEYLNCEVDVTDMFPFVAVNISSGKPSD